MLRAATAVAVRTMPNVFLYTVRRALARTSSVSAIPSLPVVQRFEVACAPDLLVADEATTALDVVVQAEVLELLARMRAEHDLALLLVSHDLAVIAEVCDRVLVAYAGELVEDGPAERVLNDPLHPYTEALLRVTTVGDWERRELEVIPGAPPEVGARLPGCRFADRCAFAAPECLSGPVPLRETADGRRVRCVRGEELDLSRAGAHGTREVAV